MKQWRPGDPLTQSDRELLQPLMDYAAKMGLTPTVKDIPTAAKIKSRFRVWKNAVLAAGLPSLNSYEQNRLRQAMYAKLREQASRRSERSTSMTHFDMIQMAMDEDFADASVIDMEKVVFDPVFRPFCAENLCGRYGANYSCPPDCGTPEQMKERLCAYQNALVFQSKWNITDYHDTAAIKQAKQSHNQRMLRIIDQFKQAGLNGIMAGASCCNLCERCAILDGEACRDPERQFSCLSAYCIYVKKLAEACGMEYCCSDGRLALFGLYAF